MIDTEMKSTSANASTRSKTRCILLALVLALALCGLTGCSSDNKDPNAAPITVSVSIDSSAASGAGYPESMGEASVELKEGDSVFDALCAVEGITISGNASYVKGINGLSEKALGSESGWTYTVNGEMPMDTPGQYKLSGDETIVWTYLTKF